MSSYYMKKELALPFDSIINALPDELRKRGFDILSSVPLDNALRHHLGVEYKRYTVFSVCNLPLAFRSLSHEQNFGLMLPCNIVVYETENGTVIAAIRPTIFMPVVDNEYLTEGAKIIERKLSEVLDRIDKCRSARLKKERFSSTVANQAA